MDRKITAGLQTVAVKHAAASGSQALVAAPAAGLKIRVFRVLGTVRVAAAQVVDVGVSGGPDSQQLFSIRASGVEPIFWESNTGFDLPAATALTSVAAAAGPELRYVVEYEIKQA